MSTVCIFGDSITWGASDVEAGGWVARLRNYFEKLNSDTDYTPNRKGMRKCFCG